MESLGDGSVGLSVVGRREYAKAMRQRYQAAASRRERSELLNEMVEVAGYTRKHAITSGGPRLLDISSWFLSSSTGS